MSASQMVFAPKKELEDPLAHLPCTNIVEHRRGQIIYDQSQPAESFYLVISGKVRLSRQAPSGRRVVMDIYQTDDFFGEEALITNSLRSAQAVVLERAEFMAWTASQIETIAAARPGLAVALLQLMVQRSLKSESRIESLALDGISRRLATALIEFAGHLGETQADGTVRLAPFTHELLAEYVGTSREIVTNYMNQFRQRGYLYYRRGEITLNRGLADWLHSGQR